MNAPHLFKRVHTQITRQAFKRETKLKIKQLLVSVDPIYLELGAGPRRGKNGWVTSDIHVGPDLMIDLLKPLPFPDNTIEMLYSSHVFEHFSTRQIENILKECRRVLKPGGAISVCVPNAEIYIDAYKDPKGFDPALFCRYKPAFTFYSKIDYINYMAYMDGHHFHLFDQENLIALLSAASFREVKSRAFDPDIDMQERDYISLYVQGIK